MLQCLKGNTYYYFQKGITFYHTYENAECRQNKNRQTKQKDKTERKPPCTKNMNFI